MSSFSQLINGMVSDHRRDQLLVKTVLLQTERNTLVFRTATLNFAERFIAETNPNMPPTTIQRSEIRIVLLALTPCLTIMTSSTQSTRDFYDLCLCK
mmetsp:Transcript_3479/g.3507  ORF Transcript_3479/g.3507 Transcript_3479/m.3507 type:complete len:97 (-) Transcript_3479:747-1037(-)